MESKKSKNLGFKVKGVSFKAEGSICSLFFHPFSKTSSLKYSISILHTQISILLIFFSLNTQAQLKSHSFEWQNPIKTGLNPYGQKDFNIVKDGSTYYLTATEMPVPMQEAKGLMLYSSKDLTHWKAEKLLFDRKEIDENAWYRDEWAAPKIHHIGNKYYLSFNNRNNKLKPYTKLGFGMAVADKITGPYQIINKDAPLAYGHHFNLIENEGKVYSYWDLDGRFYAAEINPAKAEFITKPFEMLGPKTMDNFHYLDAPFIIKNEDNYYLMFSSFYAGYIIRIKYLTSKSPFGPWKSMAKEPLVTFLEAEANENQAMKYPPGYSFAPPTQVIFNNQIFKGPGNKWYVAYHSSEKYAEPYLIIEPIEFKADGTLNFINAKQTKQKVTW